ncbi:MAG: 3-hydroxyacyl-CoA dehydrogenase/enoyl-CoA hydratase/3-hydroxybutyryl-CoA epimerase, partial [Gammaproteobacteria bacterium]
MNNAIVDWQVETDDNGVIWLTLDKTDTDTNVLSVSVLNQLEILVKQIVQDKPKAVIFQSGKKSGFIAGADVKEFLDVTNQQEALIMIKRGQNIFTQIENLPCPTVALIEGFCMGGGTELILSCDYR